METETAEIAAKAGAKAATGLPQLDFSTWPNQIFWLVVTLIVLYQLMCRVALPRISSVLEERADAISDDLDRADEYRRKAQEAEAAYDQALADARANAQVIAGETRAEILKEVEAEMAKADAEIAARAAESETRIKEIRDSALASVAEVGRDTALAVAESLMPEAADKDAISRAVQARIG